MYEKNCIDVTAAEFIGERHKNIKKSRVKNSTARVLTVIKEKTLKSAVVRCQYIIEPIRHTTNDAKFRKKSLFSRKNFLTDTTTKQKER